MYRPKRRIKHYEIQVLQSGTHSESAYTQCVKRENHTKYAEFQQLPTLIKDDLLLEFIAIRCCLTGKIEIPTQCKTGFGTRCGSGFVQKIEVVNNATCPCPSCRGDVVKQHAIVTLSSALHVIEDEEDSKIFKVRLFYDRLISEEIFIYGLTSHSREESGDWCALVCVTHDIELTEKLKCLLDRHWRLGRLLKEKYEHENSNLVVVIGHPHGGPIKVSFGKGKIKDFARDVRKDQVWCYYSYDAVTCDGSSGGPVYILGKWIDGFGYWFGHAHNHCGIDNRAHSSSTVGVESTYGQVTQSFSSIDIEGENTSLLADTKSNEKTNTSNNSQAVTLKSYAFNQKDTTNNINSFGCDELNKTTITTDSSNLNFNKIKPSHTENFVNSCNCGTFNMVAIANDINNSNCEKIKPSHTDNVINNLSFELLGDADIAADINK